MRAFPTPRLPRPLREIQYNDAGGGSRQDSMTKFENSIAVYDSGFALNYCHGSHLLDIMLSLTSSHTYSLASGSKSLAKRRVALFSARCSQRKGKRKSLWGGIGKICTTKSALPKDTRISHPDALRGSTPHPRTPIGTPIPPPIPPRMTTTSKNEKGWYGWSTFSIR